MIRMWSGAQKLAEILCVLGFLALFTVFVLQVFFRYVLNDPLSWSQEVAGILYVWIVCLGAATIVKEREHVTFSLIYETVPAKTRRVMAIIGTGLVVVLILLSLYGNFDYIAFTARQKSPTLRLPMSWIFSAFGVFLVLLVINGVVRIIKLSRPGWEQEQ